MKTCSWDYNKVWMFCVFFMSNVIQIIKLLVLLLIIKLNFFAYRGILYKNMKFMQCFGSILRWTRLYVIILSHRMMRRIVMFSGISCQMDQFPYKPTHLVHFCCIHCFVRFMWPCNFKCKCTCTNIVCSKNCSSSIITCCRAGNFEIIAINII